jgi:hypothetical protein
MKTQGVALKIAGMILDAMAGVDTNAKQNLQRQHPRMLSNKLNTNKNGAMLPFFI